MKHPFDVGAIAGYIAGGGLAGVMTFLGTLYPAHQVQFNSGAIALVALAGLVRVLANPTPTVGTASVVSTNPPSTAPQDLTTEK